MAPVKKAGVGSWGTESRDWIAVPHHSGGAPDDYPCDFCEHCRCTVVGFTKSELLPVRESGKRLGENVVCRRGCECAMWWLAHDPRYAQIGVAQWWLRGGRFMRRAAARAYDKAHLSARKFYRRWVRVPVAGGHFRRGL